MQSLPVSILSLVELGFEVVVEGHFALVLVRGAGVVQVRKLVSWFFTDDWAISRY